MIYGGVATKHSPYRVKIEEPLNIAMLSAYGPGLEKGVKSNIPTHFIVDCREVGPGELRVNIKDSDNKEIPFSLSDNKDGTHTVTYVAREPGTCSVNLNYGGLNAPQCPIKVNVESHIDISEVKVEGLAQSKYKITYLLCLLLGLIRCNSIIMNITINLIYYTPNRED